MNRADIAAYEKISTHVQIGDLSFTEVMHLLNGFTQTLLHNMVPQSFVVVQAKAFIDTAVRFSEKEISPSALKKARVQAWEMFDGVEEQTPDKHLMRVVVCCLYDEISAEFATQGGEIMIGTFLAVLFDLQAGYCEDFSNYVLSRSGI